MFITEKTEQYSIYNAVPTLSRALKIPFKDFTIKTQSSGREVATAQIKNNTLAQSQKTLKALGYTQNHKLSHRYSIDDALFYFDGTEEYITLSEKSGKLQITVTTKK